MGCITSRGENWPPKPFKRLIVREELIDEIENGAVKKTRIPVADYIWVYPGERHNGGSGPRYRNDEEASAGQEMAIRNLEEG